MKTHLAFSRRPRMTRLAVTICALLGSLGVASMMPADHTLFSALARASVTRAEEPPSGDTATDTETPPPAETPAPVEPADVPKTAEAPKPAEPAQAEPTEPSEPVTPQGPIETPPPKPADATETVEAPEPAEPAQAEPTEPSEPVTPQGPIETPPPMPADAPEPAGPPVPLPIEQPKPPVPAEGQPPPVADRFAPEPVMPPVREPGLRFNFRYQPWTDVLDWFAERADLSFVFETAPPGTFNYSDDRQYTPAEAIDLLNSVLLTKGYTLVRRERMLFLINLEDGIPPNLVSTVPAEELDDRGEFELISVLFQLEKFSPEEAEQEIQKLIGPQGSLVLLPKTQQILVTETAGRLRTIRRVIQRVEDPGGLISGQLQSYELKYILPDEATIVLRQLLDIPEDGNASADGSIRFAVDPLGLRLLLSGTSQTLAKAKEILEAVDVPGPGELASSGIMEAPQVVVYPVTVADPESVLNVLQTLLADSPLVRLDIDPKTNNLIALARPSEHATIRATLDEMQADVRRIEFIQLHLVDPELAVLSIKKMFGEAGEDNAGAPTVEADLATRQLVIHGTDAQIAQIRVLLEKMGESTSGDGSDPRSSKVRVLPFSGRPAESALKRLQELWPALRANKVEIHTVAPTSMIPSVTPAASLAVPRESDRSYQVPEEVLDELLRQQSPPADQPPADQPTDGRSGAAPEPPAPADPPKPEGKSAAARSRAEPLRGRIFFASQNAAAEPQPQPSKPQPQQPEAAGPKPVDEAPPIIVSVGPGGIMIASEDLDALNDFEDLLNVLAGGNVTGGTKLTIFYLIYAKAATVAQTLNQIIGGGSASAAGQSAGGTTTSSIGSLLSLGSSGGTISPTGSLQITPELRLNALLVEANPTDLNTITELLKILDQPQSPEDVLADAKPRMIPVYNTSADEIAEVVRQVYQDRLATSSRGGRSPSPQEFLEAMRGGRGGPRGSSRGGSTQEVQKMSLGVDSRTNSLIVSAPEPLFQEVKSLVEELDAAAIESNNETITVITLDRLNPEAMEQALSSLMGESVSFGGSSSRRTSGTRPSGSFGQPRPPGGQPSGGFDEIRRRMEFFRAMQQGASQQQGGFRPSSGGGPPGSRGFRPSSGGGPPGSRGFRPSSGGSRPSSGGSRPRGR